MDLVHGTSPAKVAEHLGDDEVHVWHLPYARSAGRAPLRDLLGHYLGCHASDVPLVVGEHGRPQLVGAGPLDFNWSHSGDVALVALARGIAPGIDIEQLRPRPRALALARRYFTPAEAAALAQMEPEARATAFLRLWTAKEAVLKALGRGLSFGLHRLDIDHDGGVLRLLRLEGDDPARWQLHALAVGSDELAALAWRGEARRVCMRVQTPGGWGACT